MAEETAIRLARWTIWSDIGLAWDRAKLGSPHCKTLKKLSALVSAHLRRYNLVALQHEFRQADESAKGEF
jgi:hypothetical protein